MVGVINGNFHRISHGLVGSHRQGGYHAHKRLIRHRCNMYGQLHTHLNAGNQVLGHVGFQLYLVNIYHTGHIRAAGHITGVNIQLGHNAADGGFYITVIDLILHLLHLQTHAVDTNTGNGRFSLFQLRKRDCTLGIQRCITVTVLNRRLVCAVYGVVLRLYQRQRSLQINGINLANALALGDNITHGNIYAMHHALRLGHNINILGSHHITAQNSSIGNGAISNLGSFHGRTAVFLHHLLAAAAA